MLSGFIAFTFVHLFIMSIYLFLGKDKKSNLWLGFFFLILSAIMFMQLAYHLKWVYDYRYLNNTDYIYSSLLGYVFYSYVCEVLKVKPSRWFVYSQLLVLGICIVQFIWFEITFSSQEDLRLYLDKAYINYQLKKICLTFYFIST
jgi:hypothetical protein